METTNPDVSAALLDPERCRQFLFAYTALRRLLGGEAELRCGSLPLIPSASYICAEDADMVFRKTQEFSAAVQTADAIDIYPLTDGRVRVELTFHRMLLRIN